MMTWRWITYSRLAVEDLTKSKLSRPVQNEDNDLTPLTLPRAMRCLNTGRNTADIYTTLPCYHTPCSLLNGERQSGEKGAIILRGDVEVILHVCGWELLIVPSDNSRYFVDFALLRPTLLSPLHACSHIRPTPRNAIVVCPLPASRPGPNSTREPSSLSPRTFSMSLLIVPPSISGWGPAHGYSWNRCRCHSVNVPNPPPSSFLYF